MSLTPLEEMTAANREILEKTAAEGATGPGAFARLSLINDPHGIAKWIEQEAEIGTDGRLLSAALASHMSAQMLNFIMTFERPIEILNQTISHILTIMEATVNGDVPITGVETKLDGGGQREVTVAGALRERMEALKGGRR